ncbi:MAG: methanogenesis marker 9 domain-containing protein [Candidatus Lokiarchaeota archaeon]|nr:methanogenesis marker 9 domain-containing protein [Candidatus Lokiarchaeota archaeon]
MKDAIKHIPKEKLRDLPGWKNAPIPICMGGDYRALTWCCKPGSTLTFGYKCLRDIKLQEIGMTPDDFIRVKEEFSKKYQWDSNYPCFGSFSYCCMRRGGCDLRDPGLKKRYPNLEFADIQKEYYIRKKELAEIILKCAKNNEIVSGFLEIGS